MKHHSAIAPSSISKRVFLSFAAVYLIWGSTYLAIRYAVETIPPFIMAGIRFLSAGSMLYAYALYKQRNQKTDPVPKKLRRIHWYSALIVGSLFFVGGNGGVVWAEQFIPSSLAALIITTVPLWMVLLDWLRPQGKRPHYLTVMGLILGFTGMVVLINPANIQVEFQSSFLPSLVLVGSALAWSCGSILSRHLRLPQSLILSSSMQMLTGGSVLLIASFFLGEWSLLEISKITALSAWSFVYLMIFGSIVAFTAYSFLLKNTTAAKVSTYAYINPIIAIFLGWSIASEPMDSRTLLAAFIIISAVVLITYTKGRKPAAEAKPIETELQQTQTVLCCEKESLV